MTAGKPEVFRSILTCELPGQGGLAATVHLRPQAINLLVGSEEPSFSFDLAGRLIGAYVGGRNYRRGLDNRVLEKLRVPGGDRQRRRLPSGEAQAFLAAAYGLADRVAEITADPRLAVLRGWSWSRLQADAAQFARVYRPVSILPPDQYLALVLQATEGCSYNRCTFCDFYRGRPFRVKGPDELRAHIAAVRAFFGPAIALRRSLFLADANALVAPMSRLRGWLDVIDQAGVLADHAEHGRSGIYSFMDAFDVHRKSPADWTELAARGVRRVYIGMESGDDALLRFLRKPGTAGDVIDAVVTLKSAGIAASVIIMTGAGGERYAAGHVAGTIAALNAMPLGGGDIVYFSPFVELPAAGSGETGSEYSRLAAEAGIVPLSAAATAAQEAAMRVGLHPHDPAHPPQLSRYDIREFIY